MEKQSFSDFLTEWNRMQNLTTPEIHLKLASWLEQKWITKDARLLVMAFRGFGKSSIVGIFCAWVLWRNPDLRILVLAADLALARKMVRQVKRIIEKHPQLKDMKPAKAEEWGGDRFTIARNSELRDPSMLAKGIDTNLTGSRAELIICDDVEVPRTSDTAYKRKDLRERLLELEYILTPDGALVYVGTPHHYETIYTDKPDAETDEIFMSGYERHVTPVMDKDGKSAWPERFTKDKIDRIALKTGPANFSSQMMCVPAMISDGKFKEEDLIRYTDDVVYNEAGGEAVLTIGDTKMVSACAWWDPAFGNKGGDKSVLAIVYTDIQGHYWLHHLQAILIKPGSVHSEAVQQCMIVAELLEQYFVPQIAIEVNGIGAFLPGILERELGQRNYKCPVIQVHSRKPKNIRINEAFDAVLAANHLHVHKTALHNSFQDELRDWNPLKKNQKDDTLDAVAGAMSMQNVKIQRVRGSKQAIWQRGGKVRIAKTVLD
ncbi:MAG: hypothetical protein DI586_02520 [Micavibrio aeruginosavorus]|uniref:Terminase large subunit gp17-like C-terminal domain-containing protein n=1 Tax=Micavibrio aeruginosavorus TaxID=349221 RepID=A0A2W5FP95_9BACT|nr:MAG: hypothetical protein DI586_02520 [Micavibrio aeruginosavorus]